MTRWCAGGPGSASGQWRPGPWRLGRGTPGHSASGARVHAGLASHGHPRSAPPSAPTAVTADRRARHGRCWSGGGRRAVASAPGKRSGRSWAAPGRGPGSTPRAAARRGGALRWPPSGATPAPRWSRAVRGDGLASSRRPASRPRWIRGPDAHAPGQGPEGPPARMPPRPCGRPRPAGRAGVQGARGPPAVTALCRGPRAARGRGDPRGPGGALGDTTPPGPTRRVGPAPPPGAWLCPGPPRRGSPPGDPAAGWTALPPPASAAVSRSRGRERPARAGRQPPALAAWTAGPHRRARRRRARHHGEADQRTGGAGARRPRAHRRPAHPSPPAVGHVPRSTAASPHAAGAWSVCAAARPRVADPEPAQLCRLRAGDAVGLRGGPGHLRPALAPARLAWPHRQPRATRARLASPRRRPDAGPLGSGGRRWRPPPARAVDRPGSCPGARPRWVPACDASGTRLGAAAPGAGAPEAPVRTTHLALPTWWDTVFTARRVRHQRARPPTVASARDTFR